MGKIALRPETFKALASESRLNVLRALDGRQKTQTEVAEELGLNKATVHEHLNVLEAVGLVRRLDEGRKWIYFQLTWEGRKMLHPDEGTFFTVLLSISGVALAGAMVAAIVALTAMGGAIGDDGANEPFGMPETMDVPPEDSASSGSESEQNQVAAQESDTGANESALRAEPESTPSDPTFFGTGGAYAVALVAASGLFLVLAVRLRRAP